MKQILCFAASILLFAGFSNADENIQPASVFKAQGYTPVQYQKRTHLRQTDPLPVRSLNWPVTFFSETQKIGNSMAQFQPFDNPGYFHGGCDLRVKQNGKVFTPVSGSLEAGHYGYVTNDDGSMTKQWKAWPKSGNATYFEVAVIDDNGYRFEFHHMDRKRLPQEIVEILNAGGGRVEAGTYLGDAVFFSQSYHHIHYNVIAPDGLRINPESISLPLADTTAPEIRGVFARSGNSSGRKISEGVSLATNTTELIVWTRDRLDSSIYDQPPVYSKLEFKSGESFAWDFRRNLIDQRTNLFPNLFSFILTNLRTDIGTLSTEGGYGTGSSLIRLPIPKNAKGEFTITLEDISGNKSSMKGFIE